MSESFFQKCINYNKAAFAEAKKLVSKVVEEAEEEFTTFTEGVGDIGNSIFTGAKDNFNTMVNSAKKMSEADNLGEVFDIAFETASTTVKTNISTAKNVFGTAVDTNQKVYENRVDNVKKVVSKGKEVVGQVQQKVEEVATEIDETVITPAVDKAKEIKSEYVDPYVELTKETFGGTDSVGDFFNKQNYLAGAIMSEFNSDEISYDSIIKKINDVNESYSLLKENKESGYQNIKSDLPEDQQKEAREYALGLLKDRLETNKENMPEYGDVSRYYNEGSLVDWAVSHPVSFAADELAGEKYNEFSHGVMGKDGIFTAVNIPTYIAHSSDDEDAVRQDSAWDLMGNIKSTVNINEDLANKEQLIADLEANIDNPEKFAEIYYQATDGMNFSADRVYSHKKKADNGEKTQPIEMIIGRDYIAEDTGKNTMATSIAKSTNKMVGTKLLEVFFGGIGTIAAAGINSGVELLDKGTDGEGLTTAEAGTIVVTEVFNTIAPAIGKKVAGSVTPAVSEKVGKFIEPVIKSGVTESVKSTGNVVNDVVNGENPTGDIVQAVITPKTLSMAPMKVAPAVIKK